MDKIKDPFKNMNKEESLAFIKNNKDFFFHPKMVPGLKAIFNDKTVVIEVLKNNGLFLRYAHESFKNDPEIVFEAVKQCGISLTYASSNLKSNIDIVTAAVKSHPHALLYTSDNLKKNKELCLKSVTSDGSCLMYVPSELTKDKDIVRAAVNQHPLSLFHASERLQNHIDFLSVIKDLPVPPNYEPWYKERMKILEILEDDSWMRENTSQATHKSKPRKF